MAHAAKINSDNIVEQVIVVGRVCACCHVFKTASEYHADRKRKDGLNPYCKVCHREKRKVYYEANRERIIAQTAEYAKANPDVVLRKAAAYRERHPERFKEAQQRYSAKPESRLRYVRYREGKGKAYKANWIAANRERVRVQARLDTSRRRARLAGNGVYSISAKDMRRLMASPCAACGGAGEHVDHIIPVSRGGRHAIGNLQMLCASCNTRKNNKTMTEWRARMALAAA